MDKIIYMTIETGEDIERNRRWYLKPEDAEIFFDPERAPMAAIYHVFTAVMLYSYFIPILLYVSIEIVKVLQNKPAHARMSNLNKELGMVDTILSNKTGTLTCNSMKFIKCSIAGTAYGRGITES
ncbi:unnamed protein product, partial [Thlaspi arvense]